MTAAKTLKKSAAARAESSGATAKIQIGGGAFIRLRDK